MDKLDDNLKEYVIGVRGQCHRLGFKLKITKTPRKNVVLLSNTDSKRIALVTFDQDEYGDSRVRSYLINRRRYQWASDEGFSLDQMIELEKEKVFIEVHPNKISLYLI
jgi:hypothetical protein